uniref:EGF-like domain-containing protein n=1 Tax=Steinernema glaseri TaxID=37863 RepID=A0A1I7Z969_9BILA
MPPSNGVLIETLNAVKEGVSSHIIYEGTVCDSYPCWNNGVCVESNSTDVAYRCFCDKYYIGSKCQYKVAEICTEIQCPPGAVCNFDYALCAENFKNGIVESCLDDPCQNDAKCVTINNDHSRCLCPDGFRGVFCEFAFQEPVVDEWSSVQMLFLLAFIIVLAAALVVFCYGSNLSCYIFVPGTRKYDRWIGPDLDDWDFDDDADLDEVVYSISGGSAPDNRLRRTDVIELKDRLVASSETTETLITTTDPCSSSSQP